MARQVARQFCWLGEVHSLVYGRRASGKNGRKLAASTRVGLKSRLVDYLGLMRMQIKIRLSTPPERLFPATAQNFSKRKYVHASLH